MIIGIGTDLVDIRRIERNLTRYGERFAARLFTAKERAYAQASAHPAATYAKRFAAKEALAKALGVGLKGLGARHSHAIGFQDIEIDNNEFGRPEISLSKAAQQKLDDVARQQSQQTSESQPHCRPHISLSDEFPFAQAYIILESY